MTSTALKPKSNFKTILFKTFKSKLVSTIVMIVLSAVSACTAVYFILNEIVLSDTNYDPKPDVTYIYYFMIMAFMFCVYVFEVFAVPKLFEDIYKKQSCDTYFSLPIKREEYYGASFLYGAFVIIVAYLVSTVIFAVGAPMLSNSSIQITYDAKQLVSLCIYVILSSIISYLAFMICGVMAGRKIHYILLAIIFIIGTSKALSGLNNILSEIWGFVLNYNSSISVDFNSATTVSVNIVQTLISSIIEIVILFAIGLYIFKKRRAEVAEVSVYGKVMPYVFLAVYSVGAYCLGDFTSDAVLSIICGVIIAFLLSIIFTSLSYKKAFTKQSVITVSCVCVVLSLLNIFVSTPLADFYVKKLPSAQDVKSAEIYEYDNDSSGVASTIATAFPVLRSALFSDDNEIELTQTESIEKLIALHEKLVDDNTIELSRDDEVDSLFDYFTGDYSETSNTFNVKIVYNLKSGSKLTRTYSAVPQYFYDELYSLMVDDEVISQLSPYNISEDNLLCATITRSADYDDDYYDYDSQLEYDEETDEEGDEKSISISDLVKLRNSTKSELKNITQDTLLDDTVRISRPFGDESCIFSEQYAIVEYFYLTSDATDYQKQEFSKLSQSEIEDKYFQDYAVYDTLAHGEFYIYKEQKNTVKLVDSLAVYNK